MNILEEMYRSMDRIEALTGVRPNCAHLPKLAEDALRAEGLTPTDNHDGTLSWGTYKGVEIFTYGSLT